MPDLDVAGARLHYLDEGSGEAPLLLIHGSSTDATTWDGIAPELAELGRVVRYDRRGYGRSEHRPVRDHRVHARDLVAVLELIGVPATVVGWSSGGNIALAVAAHRPELVARLVVVEAPFHGLRHADSAVLATALRLKIRQLRGQRERAAEEFLRFGSAFRSGGSGYDQVSGPIRAGLLANSGPVLAEWDPHPFGVMHEHMPTRALGRITAPVTWVLGGESPTWMRTLHDRAVSRLRSVETVTINGAGHLVHLDQPDTFVDTVAHAWLTPVEEVPLMGVTHAVRTDNGW